MPRLEPIIYEAYDENQNLVRFKVGPLSYEHGHMKHVFVQVPPSKKWVGCPLWQYNAYNSTPSELRALANLRAKPYVVD